jgi:hypothetical protein
LGGALTWKAAAVELKLDRYKKRTALDRYKKDDRAVVLA